MDSGKGKIQIIDSPVGHISALQSVFLHTLLETQGGIELISNVDITSKIRKEMSFDDYIHLANEYIDFDTGVSSLNSLLTKVGKKYFTSSSESTNSMYRQMSLLIDCKNNLLIDIEKITQLKDLKSFVQNICTALGKSIEQASIEICNNNSLVDLCSTGKIGQSDLEKFIRYTGLNTEYINIWGSYLI